MVGTLVCTHVGTFYSRHYWHSPKDGVTAQPSEWEWVGRDHPLRDALPREAFPVWPGEWTDVAEWTREE